MFFVLFRKQPKEPFRIFAGFRRYLFKGLAKDCGDRGRDVGKKAWLVAAAFSPHGTRQTARQQVGGIGFQKQAVGGDSGKQGDKVTAPPLVADPACNADITVN